MVRIRLTRVGRKNAPAYRIIVTDSTTKRDGRYIEKIGNYNPTENPNEINYDKERYAYWISNGAQPSLAVKKLIDGKYIYKPYNKGKVEEEVVETPEVAADTAVEAEATTETPVEATENVAEEATPEAPAEPASTDTDTESK